MAGSSLEQLRPPEEQLYTAMRFAACGDDAAVDIAWKQLHDDLITTFPTQRRGPVTARIYAGEHAAGMVDDLAGFQPKLANAGPEDWSALRSEVERLGTLLVVLVEVVMDES